MLNLLCSLNLSTCHPDNPFIPLIYVPVETCNYFFQTRCYYSKGFTQSMQADVGSLSFQTGLEQKFFHSVNLFRVISIQQPRKKDLRYNPNFSHGCFISIFLLFLSVVGLTEWSVVIERKPYTFHKPCNMLNFS